jgi:hypothetical protein
MPETARTDRRRILIVFSGLVLTMLLSSLDQTIIGTALPSIVGELNGVNHQFWVVTAYTVAMTITMPLYGRLGDRRPTRSRTATLMRSASSARGTVPSATTTARTTLPRLGSGAASAPPAWSSATFDPRQVIHSGGELRQRVTELVRGRCQPNLVSPVHRAQRFCVHQPAMPHRSAPRGGRRPDSQRGYRSPDDHEANVDHRILVEC